jgi:CheY-like chemotaxis protein
LEIAGELNIGIRQKYPIYSVTMRKNIRTIGLGIFSPNNMPVNVAPSFVHLNKDGGAGAVPNVVIVDDEQDILQTYQEYLSGQPVNVEVFVDPMQLLGRLALVGPSFYDLAILDIRMPKMNGFQVYQILAGLKPSIKTLFVTALDYAEEFLTTLRWIDKEHDIMKKPITRENFITAVNKKINICTPGVLKGASAR